jgi:hypothetical protein
MKATTLAKEAAVARGCSHYGMNRLVVFQQGQLDAITHAEKAVEQGMVVCQ